VRYDVKYLLKVIVQQTVVLDFMLCVCVYIYIYIYIYTPWGRT
jgi:hypothetical protein